MIDVYSDGGVINDGRGTPSRSVYGGTWAFVRVIRETGEYTVRSGLVDPRDGWGGTVTNNVSELVAAVFAFEAVLEEDPDWSGHWYTDSQVTLGRIMYGWAMREVPRWLQEAVRSLQRRMFIHRSEDEPKPEGFHVQGHPSPREIVLGVGSKRGAPVSVFNKYADEACQLEAQKYLAQVRTSAPMLQLPDAV